MKLLTNSGLRWTITFQTSQILDIIVRTYWTFSTCMFSNEINRLVIIGEIWMKKTWNFWLDHPVLNRNQRKGLWLTSAFAVHFRTQLYMKLIVFLDIFSSSSSTKYTINIFEENVKNSNIFQHDLFRIETPFNLNLDTL